MKQYKFTFEQLVERQNTVNEFCKLYRIEVIKQAAKLTEATLITSNESYTKFLYSLSDKALGGVMSTLAGDDIMYDLVKRIMDGENTIDDYIKQTDEAIELIKNFM